MGFHMLSETDLLACWFDLEFNAVELINDLRVCDASLFGVPNDLQKRFVGASRLYGTFPAMLQGFKGRFPGMAMDGSGREQGHQLATNN